MKKSIYIVLLLALILGACDSGFEEMNVDPTKPEQVDIKNKLSITLLYTSGSRYEVWRNMLIYNATMIQHLATTTSYWAGDKYLRNDGYASSQIDRDYENAIKTIEDMLLQVEQEGHPAEMEAIVRILRVFVFHRLTDLYGDIPYSEAGQAIISGILAPKYDKQEDIYADMLNELEVSAAALGSGTSGFGSADLIFQGDQTKWKRFANSLMLRLAMRISNVDPAGAQSWAVKAISGGVMTSNADIASIKMQTGPTSLNQSAFGQVFLVDDASLSKTLVDALSGDPRLPILAARRSDESTAIADLKGFPNGLDLTMLAANTGETNESNYAHPNRMLVSLDAPTVLQTYAEVELLLAEATLKGWVSGNVQQHYNAGVTAAMKMYEGLYGAAAAVADGDIATFLANNPYDAANGMEQISTQHWIATFFNEYETYSNWRRTGFPVLVPVNYPGNVTNGTIPRRMTYSTSEQTDNIANYNDAIASQGPDVMTTKVWWDQ